MKNEKFCFSKGTGLIALVGIVLVAAALLMGSLPGQSTSTSTKAAFGCPTGSAPGVVACPSSLWAIDETTGNPYTAKVAGKTVNCCFPPTHFSTNTCLSGSTPSTICPASKVVSGYAVRALTGARLKCCNWYGTVTQPTTVPVQVVPSAVPPVANPAANAPVDAAYCKSVGLFAVGSYNFETLHRNVYCKDEKINDVPAWNGLWGVGYAKCYTRTAVCGTSDNCETDRCVATIDAKAGCVYRELPDMSRCIAKGAAPETVLNYQCPAADPKTGVVPMVYLADGSGGYYLQAGKIAYSSSTGGAVTGSMTRTVAKGGGQPYCVNKKLTSDEVRTLTMQGAIPKVIQKNCDSETKVYGWGPSKKVTIIDSVTSVPREAMQSVCYRMNASNGKTCTAYTPTSIEICQCKDAIYGKSAKMRTAALKEEICKNALILDSQLAENYK